MSKPSLRWGLSLGVAAVALVMAGHGSAALGQAATTVTMEGAVRDALAWHPAVTQAVGEMNANSEAIAEARAGYSPQISAGVGSGYDSRVSGTWRPRPQIGASQMLFDFGKVRSAVDFARFGHQESEAELLATVDTLVRDTGLAVIELQRAAALRQVAQDQLASIGQIAQLVQDRFETGATTQSDALQAQARVDGARATLVEIEAEQRRWRSNLAYLLNHEVNADAVAPDVPSWLTPACKRPPPDWETVPQVAAADARIGRADAELRRRKAERLPTLSLGGDASTDVGSPFGDRSIYNFGLRLTGNVFGGGVTRARVRGADYALESARAAAQRARLDSQQRLAEAQQQVGSLSGLTETLAAREAAMRDTGKLYRMQYLEMGTRTLVDLLNAEQELHGVRFQAANTEHDLRRLRIDCLFYSGELRRAFDLAGTSFRGVTL
jgi:adhesin transport system outer membrane protein